MAIPSVPDKPNRRIVRLDGPDPIDVAVGARIHLIRVTCGFTQQKLAAACGVTFQQMQKYERGHNRVSASRLVQIANALDCPVSSFFEAETGQSAPFPSDDALRVACKLEKLPHVTREGLERVLDFALSGTRARAAAE